MLFDDQDFAVFKNEGERLIFVEITNLYYLKNFRSAITSLYALVIFDLYNKLNDMDELGNKNSKTFLKRIQSDIKQNKHFSDIEKDIIEFYKNSFSTYFNKFFNDIDYLTELRHKCAHLYLNDNGLYIPTQNQTKMLIESMYNNLFKVEAPFIDDLFTIAQNDIEYYSDKIYLYLDDSKGIRNKLSKKYFDKMMDISISKTIKTLFKLLFITNNDDSNKYLDGIFILLDSLLWYLQKNGKFVTIDFSKVKSYIIDRIEFEQLNNKKKEYLISFGNDYIEIAKIYEKKEGLINLIKQSVKSKAHTLLLYYNYFSEGELNELFINRKIGNVSNMDYYYLFEFYAKEKRISYDDFFITCFKMIGTFNSFSTADVVSTIFINNLDSVTENAVKNILNIYNNNKQCYNRIDNEKFVQAMNGRKSGYPNINFLDYKNIFPIETN